MQGPLAQAFDTQAKTAPYTKEHLLVDPCQNREKAEETSEKNEGAIEGCFHTEPAFSL